MADSKDYDQRILSLFDRYVHGTLSRRYYVAHNYVDVNYGFHNDTPPRHDEAAAELAWQRTIQHFTEHL